MILYNVPMNWKWWLHGGNALATFAWANVSLYLLLSELQLVLFNGWIFAFWLLVALVAGSLSGNSRR